MATLIRILEARPLQARNVELTLSNGQVVQRDLSPLLRGCIFEAVRDDDARFKELRVEAGTLVWPGGADLCPDVVIWGGLPPADVSSSAA